MNFENTLIFAEQLDAEDPLKSFRKEFIIPKLDGTEQIYFLGNSLGLQPKTTKAAIDEVLTQWADYGVEGFFRGKSPWMDYHDKMVGTLSEIVGAFPREVVVMNQLTVNLHLMMISFYKPSDKKRKILCEAKAFPSDQYMFETHIKHYGFDPDEVLMEISPRKGEYCLRTADIIEAIENNKDELALVFLGGLNYYTGQVLDMETITKASHKAGCMAGFDLAHAAGNISLSLHDWDVDFACWCSYKYLNSGPGSVGGVYIHERFHNDKNINRFAGWWGYDKAARFKMEKGFNPVNTAEGWQLSTPSILLYTCHNVALKVFKKAGWQNIQIKFRMMNDYFWFLLDEINKEANRYMEIITPQEKNQRGCQVSLLMHKNGKAIFEKLSAKGIMADWREPNVIRAAPVPLYNTYKEIWQFYDILNRMINT